MTTTTKATTTKTTKATTKKPAAKPAVKKTPIAKATKEAVFNGLESVNSYDFKGTSYSYNKLFTKGWDYLVLKNLEAALTLGKDELVDYITENNKERKYIVHYIGLFAFYKELGYKTIAYKGVTADLSRLEGAEVTKPLKSWVLLKQIAEVKKVAKISEFSFKAEHLIRANELVKNHEGITLAK